ncbi:unnamed protein product [Durusdinium trenchii]|uniref:Uncharacterized protein n=1 Tax=Durusdinium trenchii TaxID=1381693 RepID=A0ABP0NAH5_9DINO
MLNRMRREAVKLSRAEKWWEVKAFSPPSKGVAQELMASWKAQPLLLTFGVLLGVAAIGLLILKTQKLMETYREFMKKAA